MPRKKAENAPATSSDAADVSLSLGEIFKSLQGHTASADQVESEKSLDQIAKDASGLMGKVLGNYDDYVLLYQIVMDRDSPLRINPIGAELKVPRDQDTERVCDAIAIFLDRHGLSAELAMEVFRSVDRTVNNCWIRYRVNPQTADISYIRLGDIGAYFLGDKGERYLPASARAAKASLSATAEFWLLRKIRAEIEPLNLGERIAEISRRIARPIHNNSIETSRNDLFPEDYYKSLLSRIKDELEDEFEIEKSRLEGLKAIMIVDVESNSPPVSDSATGEKARQEKTPNGLPEAATQLARNCRLFMHATPETQQIVWSKLRSLTRTQWAMFFIEIDPTRTKWKSKADAIREIIKPKAKLIEDISGLSNMRGVAINERSQRHLGDQNKVDKIIQLLKADSIVQRSI